MSWLGNWTRIGTDGLPPLAAAVIADDTGRLLGRVIDLTPYEDSPEASSLVQLYSIQLWNGDAWLKEDARRFSNVEVAQLHVEVLSQGVKS